MIRWACVRILVAISVIRGLGLAGVGGSRWLPVRRGASRTWPLNSAALALANAGTSRWLRYARTMRDARRVCAGRAKALSGPAREGVPAQRGGSAPHNPIPPGFVGHR